MEEITEILAEDSQALWVVLHRSLAHKMDYHLSLCYPSDIKPSATYLDSVFWSMLERVVGQQIPRINMGWGFECMLNIPVESMAELSFQELFIRSPIRLRGFGLRSLVQSIPAAFIGGVERSVSAFPGEGGICRKLEHLLGGGTVVEAPPRLQPSHWKGELGLSKEGGAAVLRVPGQGAGRDH